MSGAALTRTSAADDELPAGTDPKGELLFTNAALLPLTACVVAACAVDACVVAVTAEAGDPLNAIAPARTTLVAIFTDLFLNTSSFHKSRRDIDTYNIGIPAEVAPGSARV